MKSEYSYQPLAERMRPNSLDEYVGQKHLIGPEAPLRRMVERGHLPSMILWGPPGVGKTTLAQLLSTQMETKLFKLSAISSGVAEVRQVLQQAEQHAQGLFASTARPLLFIDEIHRFSKSQQDSLLAAVEKGTITLIGATTENPSFEVIRPLLSRCQVFVLNPLEEQDLKQLLHRAITEDYHLSALHIDIQSERLLLQLPGGDARKLLNLLEMVVTFLEQGGTNIVITDDVVGTVVKQQPQAFDKGGELHYDIASAFIKSIRGSDPQAALYWMSRLIEGGEDPRFIARRIVISAAEDIGLANPNALLIAEAAARSIDFIGWPEGRIPLAEAVIYLATSPKSNSAYMAINEAIRVVKETGNLPVPLHLRNAPTQLMNKLGYSMDYKYAHNYPYHYINQQYLPDQLVGTTFYTPQEVGSAEIKIKEYLNRLKLMDQDTKPCTKNKNDV